MTKILDCTLRDGGYYNNWEFSPEMVQKYLNSCSDAGIDIVEIGFRFPEKEKFLGAFAHTSDAYLERFEIPTNIELAVMINAADYINNIDINDYFLPAAGSTDSKKSKVSMVRIATHFDVYKECRSLVDKLKNKGYRVGFNLMQFSSQTNDVIQDVLKDISSWENVDVLYFADSFGNMRPEDIQASCALFKDHWNGEFGIHAHNNCNLALTNSLVAKESGATYLDATILGMGRGAGNTQTEYLLIELKKLGFKVNPDAIFPLVFDEFKHLKEKYRWGDHLAYYLAAEANIHPTYIQEILGNSNYQPHHLVGALRELSLANAEKYVSRKLSDAVGPNYKGKDGDWSPSQNMPLNEEVLIIANGSKLEIYKNEIEDFIQKRKPTVISLNLNKFIDESLIDFYTVCNQTRFFMDANKYLNIKKPIVMPLEAAPKSVIKNVEKTNVKNYGMEIKEGIFESLDKKCVISKPYAFEYALAIINNLNPQRVFLAGFDGYPSGDERNLKTKETLHLLNEDLRNKLFSLTPTTHSIKLKPIFTLDLKV